MDMMRVDVMRKAKVFFIGCEVEFVDRELAIKLVEELAEKGTDTS